MRKNTVVYIIIFLIEVILSILLVFCAQPYYELSFRFWIVVIFGLIDFWCVLYKKQRKYNIKEVIAATPVSILIGGAIFLLTSNKFFIWNININKILIFMLITLKLYFYILLFLSGVIQLYFKEFSFDKFKYDFLIIASFLFFFWIFIPTEMYINNSLEMEASYSVYILPLLICYFVSLFGIFTLFLGTEHRFLFRLFFVVCEIGAYVQYLFFNNNLSILNGLAYTSSALALFGNLCVWVVVIVVSIIVERKKNGITWLLTSFIFGIQLLTSIYIVVMAPKDIWNNRAAYEMADKQYAVAKGKNVIVFVLDAVDNHYVKELLSDNDDIFKYYNDFTLYTNTCSVFDVTLRSMPQMFSGSSYKGEMIDYDRFYNRLHDNNYEILFFNYEEDRGDINLYKYLDNYKTVLADGDSFVINYYKIIKSSARLSLYIMAPDVMKNLANPSELNLKNVITINSGEYTNSANYNNKEFDEDLVLTLDEDAENAFIMQHINGAHWPCSDYVGETKYCMEIVGKYIQQLQNLGLYDEATIIITSDHGWQDDGEYPPYPTAGTPMFMIKSPHANQIDMQLNDTPIYHTDFLSTILINVGLYDKDEDENLFGTSIYDFEGRERTRIWVNRSDEKYYKYCVYTYTGNTEELERVVNEGLFEKMY